MKLDFGKNLKRLRRERDMTQDELAHVLSLSVQAVSRYETGTAYPDIELLPVISGFFGTSVDDLLGVSATAREKRMDEYLEQLRKITDRKDRLDLLRREHAEFPDNWSVVSDMVYQMTYIPEYLDEMREIVVDALKRCDEPIWRENIILHYLRAESDDEKAIKFIDKYSYKYDLRKVGCLIHRYRCRGDSEKLRSISQIKLRDELHNSLIVLSQRDGECAEKGGENCRWVLDFIDELSQNNDRTRPDMWINTKLICMLRMANNSFAVSQDDDGFRVLETAIRLFENFFALPSDTVLTYGSSKLDCLKARTNKKVYYGVSEFTGLIAESMMVELIYEHPTEYIKENEKYIHDMEGLEGETIFSSHTYNILKNAEWDGFSRIKDDPRYLSVLKRVWAVSSIENLDNVLFMIREQAERNDDWIKDQEWICALLVPDIGAYVVFGSTGDLDEKIERMKRDGNTKVCMVITAKIGEDLISPPEAVVRAVVALDKTNSEAQVIMSDTNGDPVFYRLEEWISNN